MPLNLEKLRAPLLQSRKVEQGVATIKEQVEFLVAYDRKKCSALLFFGAMFGFFGFAFAFIIGAMKFSMPLLSDWHKTFPSGYGYFPATVSEMVHDPTEPAGKCFFAFEFIGAFFLFMSWYPWELRNVYIGDSDQVPLIPECSWSMFRQFVPPVGMMLVATVTTTPFAQATLLDYFCIAIHLTGAILLFGGYMVVEAYAIGWMHLSANKVITNSENEPWWRNEIWWRKLCVTGIAFWYSVFCVLTVVMLLPLDELGGQIDVWEPRNVTAIDGTLEKKVILTDTAGGWVLGLKILSYMTEVFCGLFLIGSFMVIWYFCDERKADLEDTLFKLS